MTGTVKRLVSDKGFGFILGEDGVEYFFHRSSCEDFNALGAGERVSFQPGAGQKGPRAEDVERA